MKGMSGHQSPVSMKDEWLTPPHVLEALGAFDLDPCSPRVRLRDTATRHYSIDDDGLAQHWDGRVWLNPPYGPNTGTWLERLADHGDGVALIFARTETDAWVKQVWRRADAVLFLFGRLRFHHADGSRGGGSGAPSALVAYGAHNVESLRRSGLPGQLVPLGATP